MASYFCDHENHTRYNENSHIVQQLSNIQIYFPKLLNHLGTKLWIHFKHSTKISSAYHSQQIWSKCQITQETDYYTEDRWLWWLTLRTHDIKEYRSRSNCYWHFNCDTNLGLFQTINCLGHLSRNVIPTMEQSAIFSDWFVFCWRRS